MYDAQTMIERIKEIKKQRGFSNETLSAESGIPKGTLAKILGSETKDPQISSIIKIANALDISADYLVFGETRSQPAPLSSDEEILLAKYRSLNQQGKSYILQTLDMAAQVYIKNNSVSDLDARNA